MWGHTGQAGAYLRKALLEVPGKIAALCRQEQCDLVLLAGDLFDGSYTPESYRVVYNALEEMGVPVFVAPGNHDYVNHESPWEREVWPANVHIFRKPQIESVVFSTLDCRVYGAGFGEMDCPALLENFRAEGKERYAIGVFHGDPTQISSPYNPITNLQVSRSNLSYLALGHIHKAGMFRAGQTLCAWPGCPMGTGFDELGIKGVYITQLDTEVSCRFVPVEGVRFYDLQVAAGEDAAAAVKNALPAAASDDFYRITLIGGCQPPDLDAIAGQISGFANLQLRDKTVRPVDMWKGAGEDSFQGVYFGMLKAHLESAPEEEKEKILLAAKLSRRILMGEEVALP